MQGMAGDRDKGHNPLGHDTCTNRMTIFTQF